MSSRIPLPKILRSVVLLLSAITITACIWDATTLENEKARRPSLAAVILNTNSPVVDPAPFLKRIADLNASPRTNDVNWWNDLAGAHLRLNQPDQAAKLLAPIVDRFADNYGIHANLGTALHLLGNYAEAEREIRRGLQLNPQAHFGLERYHLALLQYLIRDNDYKRRHVFVEEWTISFLENPPELLSRLGADVSTTVTNSPAATLPATTNSVATTNQNSPRHVLEKQLAEKALLDPPPEYRSQWNLATDTNFVAGVTYMAELNPNEPATFVMASIAAFAHRDFNLGIAAFERAIKLNSPQADLLQMRIADAKEFIAKSEMHPKITWPQVVTVLGIFVLTIAGFVATVAVAVRHLRRSRGP
jgi:hypothetical protein